MVLAGGPGSSEPKSHHQLNRNRQELPLCLCAVLLCKITNGSWWREIQWIAPHEWIGTWKARGRNAAEQKMRKTNKQKTPPKRSKACVEKKDGKWYRQKKTNRGQGSKVIRDKTREQNTGNKVTKSKSTMWCSLSGRKYSISHIKEKWKGVFSLGCFLFFYFCV